MWRENIEFCSADGSPVVAVAEGIDPLAGVEIDGRYRLRSLLGAGGMGFVYLAEQIGLGREVAVKMLYAERLKDPSIVRRFRREGRALAALDHPGCVRVLDVGEIEGTGPYLVMEVVGGTPLDVVLHAHERLPVRHVAYIGAQLADALAAAHSSGIVHRDLKPANVNLEAQGTDLVVRVLDFGLALLAAGVDDGSSTEARLTRAGVVFGTPEYMAPEQATSTDADARTDLYALGVMLYELATGVVPFRGPTPGAVLAMHSTVLAPPLDLFGVPTAVGARFEDLVRALLAKKPEDRPQSAADVAVRLRELHQGLPTCGPPSSVLVLPAVTAVAAGSETLDAGDLDNPRPPRTTDDIVVPGGVPGAAAARAPHARSTTASERPFSGLTGSAQADQLLEVTLSAVRRRRRARLITLAILGSAALGLGGVLVMRWRAAQAVGQFDASLPPNIPHANGKLLVAEPRAPQDPANGPVNAVRASDVPGGSTQVAYETARHGLERDLGERGLRSRDLLAHDELRELWLVQDRMARERRYAEATTAITRLGEMLGSVQNRALLDARLRVAERQVRGNGSQVSQASVRALRATIDDASRDGEGTRRFMRRVEEVERARPEPTP